MDLCGELQQEEEKRVLKLCAAFRTTAVLAAIYCESCSQQKDGRQLM